MIGGRTQRPKIRAPRRVSSQHPVPNGIHRANNAIQPNPRSPDEANFEKAWADLAESFRNIHTRNASTLSYEELYRKAYEIVLRKRGDLLYQKVLNFESEWLNTQTRAQITPFLSPELLSPLSTASAVERRTAGERFLKTLKTQWTDHDMCIAMMADVTMYLVRICDSARYLLTRTGSSLLHG
jgi:cullin 3